MFKNKLVGSLYSYTQYVNAFALFTSISSFLFCCTIRKRDRVFSVSWKNFFVVVKKIHWDLVLFLCVDNSIKISCRWKKKKKGKKWLHLLCLFYMLFIIHFQSTKKFSYFNQNASCLPTFTKILWCFIVNKQETITFITYNTILKESKITGLIKSIS